MLWRFTNSQASTRARRINAGGRLGPTVTQLVQRVFLNPASEKGDDESLTAAKKKLVFVKHAKHDLRNMAKHCETLIAKIAKVAKTE